MATVQDHPRTATPARHEAFVEQQLARALGRIRMLDVTAAVFGLLAGTLVYGLVMILFGWSWPSLYRQIALGLYGLAALAYLGVVLVRPLLRRVNPYYAAKQVEQAVPGAKNSLVNWLDLHAKPLPPAIRGALGLRAAHDLAQADLERAINARQVFWLGGAVFSLILAGLVALCILRPGPFFSRFFKAFAPFSETTMATRTRLQLLEPAGGDAVVPINQSVAFAVRVAGVVPEANRPDSVRLLFRYNESDPGYQEKPFEPGNSEREWGTRLPAFQVQNGFWYRVAGGDAVTPEYHVQVRSTPLLTGFDVTYHYQPYLHWRDATSRDPNLEALRGTHVTLVAHTNRTVAEGRLFLEGQPKSIQAELDPAQPDALRFRVVLDQDSQYRIRFTSSQGEENANPMPYRIHVLHDQPPHVELTKPGENITLPSNGVLQLEGLATDDIGLTGLTLRMRVKDGATLQPRPYRGGVSFKLVDGTYPRRLEYKDFVELDKVKDEKGEPVPLRAGTVLEYWLEAIDNCDYPQPNVGRSEPIFEVKIIDPEKNQQKMEQQRTQAKQEQHKHEAQQDRVQEKENQDAKERAAAQQNPEQAEKERKEQEQKLKDIEKKLQDAMKDKQRQEEREGPRGQSKDEPKPEPKGESKDKGQSDGKGEAKQQPEPQPQPGQQPGQGKDGGQRDAQQQPKAQEKPENKPGQGQDQPAQGKPDLKPDQQPGQGKNEGKSDPQAADKKQADGQRKPQPQQNQNPSQGKPEGNPLPDSAKGNDKKGGQDNGPSSAGEAKGDQQAHAKAEPKPGGKDVTAKGTPQGKLKQGDPGSKTAGAGKGEPGSDPHTQVDGKGMAKGSDKDPDKKPVASDNPGDVGQETPPTAEDVQSLAKKLQSPDKKEREEAIKKLQEISQQGTKLSKDAADQLKKAGHDAAKEPGSGPDDPASKKQPGDGGAAGSKPKGQGPDGNQGAGTPKTPGQPDAKQGSEGGGNGKPVPKEHTPESGNAPGDAKNGNPSNGGTPGGGSRTGEAGAGGPEEPGAEPADPNNQKKAGELQLKTFKEQVTRDMLKKHNISEEEYRQFLKAYDEANRRKAQQPQPKEPATGPQHGGSLGNVGPKRVDPGTAAKPDNVQGAGPSVPPPEYRKAYKDFTEELSKLKRAKKQ